MSNTTKKNKTPDVLIERIPDHQQPHVIGEVWKSRTPGDPVIEYHYYKVFREYTMGKRTIGTTKMRPENAAADQRVTEIVSSKSKELDISRLQ